MSKEPSAGEREGAPLAGKVPAGEREGAPLAGKGSAGEPEEPPLARKAPAAEPAGPPLPTNHPTNLVPLPTPTEGDPVAVVGGEAVLELPADLHIPPDALEVILETFEGPLDLLLYLIRRRNLDILNVSVAEVTEQYMRYIELMKVLKLTLAGEYLLMAATLASIKSRMLLPHHAEDGEEEDPRAELVRRLQEYEQIRTAAEDIAGLPRLERDIFLVRPQRPEVVRRSAEPVVDLKEVLVALAEVLHRAEMLHHHAVRMEPLSVEERMSDVLAQLGERAEFVPFPALFRAEEGRMGVVVTFIAVTELIREGLIDFVQNDSYAPIYVRAAG